MSNFSLSWFKRQHELESLIIEEQFLKNEILRQQVVGETFSTKPYKSIKLVNDVLTVILNDGSIVTKNNATELDFNRIRTASSEGAILSLVSSKEVAEEKVKQEAEFARMQSLQKGIAVLKTLSDFEVEEDSVKLAGTGRTMPQLLVERFIEIVDTQAYYAGFGDLEHRLANNEEYQALKRFFMWCCLNPRAEVANDLYDFLQKNSFNITKQGFFVALRNVVTLHGGTEFVQFVSNAYNKVKAVWKKSPDKYTVFLENGAYKLVHEDDLTKEETFTSTTCPDCLGEGGWEDEDNENWIECELCGGSGEVEEYTYTQTFYVNHGERLGGLTELYLDLPNRAENRFTDAHTRTFDIRVGKVTNMPPEECNWNTADCGHAGLHFTADHINYVGCGDTSVLILINPMKVVGIGELKGRCYEYLPIMTVPTEESTTILHDLDFDTLELDEDYAIRELQNLADKAKDGFVIEASKHQFNIPAMTHAQIESIAASLDEMKNTLSKRVSSIQ